MPVGEGLLCGFVELNVIAFVNSSLELAVVLDSSEDI